MRRLIFVAAACLPAALASAQNLSILPGQQTVISLDEIFDSISVGNPEIVDVLPKSDRVFVVVGKKPGASDIIAFSSAKPIYRSWVNVNEGRAPSRVFNHSRPRLENFTSYECNPVCIRVEDKNAPAPAPQGQPIVVIVPPAAAP